MKMSYFSLLSLMVPLVGCASDKGNNVAPPDSSAADTTQADAIADDGMTFTADQCRWQGYGIGAPPNMQCDHQHLLVHSAAACIAAGANDTTDTRDLAGACPSGPQEVQILCCFSAGVPAPNVTPVPSVVALDERVSRAGAAASRDDLITDAQSVCVGRGLALGDWSVLYAPDGVSAQLLRFACH